MAGYDDPTEEIAHLRSLAAQATRRLRKLEEQGALLGRETPVSVALEIEDLKAQIAVWNERADALEKKLPRRLIVIRDPDPPMAAVLSRLVFRIVGDAYEIVIAESDLAALALAGSRYVALLITEIADGWGLVDGIRKVTRTTEIIAQTYTAGRYQWSIELEARKHGVRYYLTKPYDPALLRVIIRQALDMES